MSGGARSSGGSPDLLTLAQRIAGLARDGEQVEAFVARGSRTAARAYGGEVESLTVAESTGVGIRVIADHRQGFAYAGTLDEGVIAEVLADARDNAVFGEPDEWFGLAEPDGVEPVEIDVFSPELATWPTERKVAFALELEAATRALDARASVRSAMYGDSIGEAAIATSAGIAQWSQATACWLSVSALLSDGTETHTGGGIDVGRHPGELAVDVAARDAVDRASRLFGAGRPVSQRVRVLLDQRVGASFLAIVGGTLTGERVLKKRSPFADRIGEQIASPLLTLVDDATDTRSFGADSHDGEGLATRRNVLIQDGVLQGFLHNAYTGRRSGGRSTGSAVRGYASTPGVGCLALAPAAGSGSMDDLVAQVGDGLLVQSLSGVHSGVNAVSGDFSVGIEGMMIRNGVLAEPVREATIASTIQKMLLGVSAVGGELEWLPSGDAGVALVIDDLSLSGD